MTIPFLDLGAAYAELGEELDAELVRVARGGRYLLGEELLAFEREFAHSVGARHCVGVATGLDALTLTLRACNVGAGDDVLVPSNTFIATWLAVTATGARPVPVEPDASTRNVTEAGLEAAVTPATRAVVPVHLYGRPADTSAISAWAHGRSLLVLEDAAQAHGAVVGGRPVGSFGVPAAWSFYPGKNLGALGDGGAVTTDDSELAERLRLLRNYGSRVKYVHEVSGVNSRLDELQAAVLRVKLRRLAEWNSRRQEIAELYVAKLVDTGLVLPSLPGQGEVFSWHLFVVRSPQRDALRARLRALGVETLIHYSTPPHVQPVYASGPWKSGDLPVAEELAATVLSLPIGPHLTLASAHLVAEAVKRATQELAG